jgi:hypothetical protein
MQGMFPTSRNLIIELLVMLKMHFYQVLIPNVDASFMT